MSGFPARWADGPGPGPTASAGTRHTAPAETAATCADATSSTASRNRRTDPPIVDAKEVRAEDPPVPTVTDTGAATWPTGPSTASRFLALSQPVTTNEPRPQQSTSGSSREMPGPASQNPGAGMKLGHHWGTPLGQGGVAAPSQKIEMKHQTAPRSVTARAKIWRSGRFPRRAPTATQTSIRTVQRPGMNSQNRKTLLAALVHSHVTGGPRPAQKHGSGYREKQSHRRPENPMQPSTPHRPPVRHPLREAPDPHRSSLPNPPSPQH